MANHNWFIGQTIVCIKTSKSLLIKDGDVFSIKSLRQGCCTVEINVGTKIPPQNDGLKCSKCGLLEFPDSARTLWWCERLFAPLDTLTDITEIEEILKQPVETLFKVN